MASKKWQFWIDRGGTFTDIIGRDPEGNIHTHKLLSENPKRYADAAVQGIRDVLGLRATDAVPASEVEVVRMGTTVATNALLEHKGEPLLLVVTKGFKDALRIAWQQRPDLFALDIQLPHMLYTQVAEVNERILASGEVITPLDINNARQVLQHGLDSGLRAIAIVLMHGYRYTQHEKIITDMAREMGFTQVAVSHKVSPLPRFVSRGDTTVVDAYLSPVLHRYIQSVAQQLADIKLLFMQSNGGLTEAEHFSGKDAILSGPAGGVVGMIRTARQAGFQQLIGFDMGGTSTDMCHYDGELERSTTTEIAGVRISTPMLRVHTIAAGGSSIVRFSQGRLRVGPESAGAKPGPVAYRNSGPLTITDCNVQLGKLQPDFFPSLFGASGDEPLDVAAVNHHFERLAAETGKTKEAIAEGFITVAVENMANAIKKVSVQRGYDIGTYTLCSFGGAGGQHACRVADALGMRQIFMHEYAGVLSAYGMGVADIRKIYTQSVDMPLEQASLSLIKQQMDDLCNTAMQALEQQITPAQEIRIEKRLHCHYAGSDSVITLDFVDSISTLARHYKQKYKQQFGFAHPHKTIRISVVEVEAVIAEDHLPLSSHTGKATANESEHKPADTAVKPCSQRPVYMHGKWQDVPFYKRTDLPESVPVAGPAIMLEETGTVVIEQGWEARLERYELGSYLALDRKTATEISVPKRTTADPVLLEVFNNLFMSIAEQMGFVLENTAVSVNIKERLDFSCAIFDPQGALVANAPHMPVHLGSMSESIKAVMQQDRDTMVAGDAFVLNDPYNGGTHLPDITVVRPVFLSELGTPGTTSLDVTVDRIVFYVAARGHHADIGGISPGSIPPDSQILDEEGILIRSCKLVEAGVFQETKIRAILGSGAYPARNIECNIADLKAQLAACEKGVTELARTVAQFGVDVVEAYMTHVQKNAEMAVRQVISALHDGTFRYEMDDGSCIQVSITVNHQRQTACIDFTGTSAQHPGNLNAPLAITKAAVLYVFRTLVSEDIPLNEGCLKPLEIRVPSASILNPSYPAAVVAGNVETSQYIVDTLYGALGTMAASQGTMNNTTWGNAHYQYYETLCGGAGATANATGADAVHTHMTNSRLTDPELLEQRFPVMLQEFSIREHSGGDGMHKGGNGVVRKTTFLEPMHVNILSGHRCIPPYGMAGGKPGKIGINLIQRRDGTKQVLSFKDYTEVEVGDTLIIKTPGGGGYGEKEI